MKRDRSQARFVIHIGSVQVRIEGADQMDTQMAPQWIDAITQWLQDHERRKAVRQRERKGVLHEDCREGL